MMTKHRKLLHDRLTDFYVEMTGALNNQAIKDEQIIAFDYSEPLKIMFTDFGAESKFLKSSDYDLYENSFIRPSERKKMNDALYD